MTARTKAIDPDVIEVLKSAKIEGTTLRLVGQLDRKLYLKTNDALEALGGRWNRKLKAHVFPGDPREAIAEAIGAGAYASAGDEQKQAGFFPTPQALARQLVGRVKIARGARVLEPSAGTGALADAVKAAQPDVDLHMCELLEGNRSALAAKGYPKSRICADFLEYEPDKPFDVIVMNPPFAKSMDIVHVTRAYGMLAEGGTLAAIMSPGFQFRDDSKAKAFRELLESTGAQVIENPDKSFHEAGTDVRTVTVIMKRALRAKAATPKAPTPKKASSSRRLMSESNLPLVSSPSPGYTDEPGLPIVVWPSGNCGVAAIDEAAKWIGWHANLRMKHAPGERLYVSFTPPFGAMWGKFYIGSESTKLPSNAEVLTPEALPQGTYAEQIAAYIRPMMRRISICPQKQARPGPVTLHLTRHDGSWWTLEKDSLKDALYETLDRTTGAWYVTQGGVQIARGPDEDVYAAAAAPKTASKPRSPSKQPSAKKPTPKKASTKRSSKPASTQAGPVVRLRPFTEQDANRFNALTHFPTSADRLNDSYQNDLSGIIDTVNASLRRWNIEAMPEDVVKAIERYARAMYARGMTSIRAREVAPPWTVVGRSNYKGRPDKANRMEDRAQEQLEKARLAVSRALQRYSPRAAVSSDDPEAVRKLGDKLAKLEKAQLVMTESNKIIRKKGLTDEQKLEALRAQGLPAPAAILKPDFAGRIGYADYQTKNNGAEIRRVKARIEELSKASKRTHKETPFQGGTLVENVAENRLQLVFDAKPPEEVRNALKSHGFRYSPTQNAWQRQLSVGASYWAKDVLQRFGMPLGPETAAGVVAEQIGQDVELPASTLADALSAEPLPTEMPPDEGLPPAKAPSPRKPSPKAPSPRKPTPKKPTPKKPTSRKPSPDESQRCACHQGRTCDISHDPAVCSCAQCKQKAPSPRKPTPKKPTSRKPSTRLFIFAPDALDKLGAIEGATWVAKQKRGGVALDNGFFLNLAAYRVLAEMGLLDLGQPLADLDPTAGAIFGVDSLYAVMPDGEIVMVASASTADKQHKASRHMQVLE